MPLKSKRSRRGYINRSKAFTDPLSAIQASRHQGSDYYHENHRGKQCSCMSLTFLLHASTVNIITTDTLNTVLNEGDKLYGEIRKSLLLSKQLHESELLCTDDLPSQVCIGSLKHAITYHSSVYCRLDSSTGSILESLDIAIQQSFCTSSSMILVIGEYMVAIHRFEDGKIGLFDSHSRNASGLPKENGSATLTYFKSLDNVFSHIRKLCTHLNLNASSVFEIKPVAVSTMLETTTESINLQGYERLTNYLNFQATQTKKRHMNHQLTNKMQENPILK